MVTGALSLKSPVDHLKSTGSISGFPSGSLIEVQKSLNRLPTLPQNPHQYIEACGNILWITTIY